MFKLFIFIIPTFNIYDMNNYILGTIFILLLITNVIFINGFIDTKKDIERIRNINTTRIDYTKLNLSKLNPHPYSSKVNDTSKIYVDNDLTEMILIQFIKDMVDNGMDGDAALRHIKELDGIYIGDKLDSINLLGITIHTLDTLSPTGHRGVIILSHKLLNDKYLYILTLYHELGHWFGIPHCDCTKDIMTPRDSPLNRHYILSNWDKMVKNLMKKIKKEYNSKGYFNYPYF